MRMGTTVKFLTALRRSIWLPYPEVGEKVALCPGGRVRVWCCLQKLLAEVPAPFDGAGCLRLAVLQVDVRCGDGLQVSPWVLQHGSFVVQLHGRRRFPLQDVAAPTERCRRPGRARVTPVMPRTGGRLLRRCLTRGVRVIWRRGVVASVPGCEALRLLVAG